MLKGETLRIDLRLIRKIKLRVKLKNWENSSGNSFKNKWNLLKKFSFKKWKKVKQKFRKVYGFRKKFFKLKKSLKN